jgi:hypothetical protein
MPPPLLPRAASGLVSIVATTVFDITRRQGTDVSTSDIIRGVHAAQRAGLVVIDFTFVTAVTDAVHAEGGNGHKEGFCPACAAIHVAVNKAMISTQEIS